MQTRVNGTMTESKIEDLPVYFLFASGHCGIDYLHSLLDSHPQILLMPSFSFFRSWKMLGCDKIKDAGEMFSAWQTYIEEHPGMQFIRRKLFYNQEESERFYPKFRQFLESGGISRVNVFYALHKAYSFAMNINLSSIRVLIAQEHIPFYLPKALADFPQAGILQIIRDPRTTMAGSWRWTIKVVGYLSDYYFNFAVENWMQGFENWKNYGAKLGSKYKVVRNEDLHASLESQMQNVADWMGIDFSPGLLKCTFSGKKWEGESAYMTADNKYPQPEEVFYLPENVRKRWMKELTFNEIAMIEFIAGKSMKEFGYDRLTKNNIFWRIHSFFIFILPHRGLFRRVINSYSKLGEFNDISRHLGNSLKGKIWKYLPRPLKFVSIVSHSILVRIKIHFFPGDRGRKYV